MKRRSISSTSKTWTLATLMALALGGMPLTAHAQWAYQYEGDVLPHNATPPWANNDPNNFFTTDGTNLIQNSTTGAFGFFNIGTPYWNSPNGFGKIETRLRAVSHSTEGAGATVATRLSFVGSSTAFYQAFFTTNSVQFNAFGGTDITIPLDTTQFHTYLFEMNGNSASLFVDGGANGVIHATGPTSSGNTLYIGDLDFGPTGGQALWDYVYWTNVPEPSSAMLFGVAGLVLWRRRAQHK